MSVTTDTAGPEATGIARASALGVDICGTSNFMWPTPVVHGENALDRAVRGGIDCAVITIAAYDETFMKCLANIMEMYHFIDEHQNRVYLAKTVPEVERAQQDAKVAIVLALQTGTPVETDWQTTLPVLAHLGVRQMQLTYNERNRLGSGCLEPADGGLTAYGRQVLRGLKHFGVAPDIAHAGRQTARDIVELFDGPVVCSHANAWALTNHPRNLKDDLIKQVAERGGVLGIGAWTPLNVRSPGEVPTRTDFLDHVEYVAQLVGPKHVGIGLDLNENVRAMPVTSMFSFMYDTPGHAKMPQSVHGLDNLAQFADVAADLANRGYSADDVAGILGANYLRVVSQIWPSS